MRDNPNNLQKGAIDPAERARQDLSALAKEGDSEDVTILDPELKAEEAAKQAAEVRKAAKEEEKTAASEERSAAPVITQQSERNRARLLLISRDLSILEAESVGAKYVAELAAMFVEVHVIVLTLGRGRSMEIKRIGDYAWVYQTDSRAWWRTIFDARKIAKQQLMFGEGFRPDIIVATDPFEAGVAGHLIAKRYNRPLQVHINEDFFYAGFEKAEPQNNWRLSMANFVLKRVSCVRTTSSYIQNRILERYKSLQGKIELLPVYHNLEAWANAPISFDLRQEYPQFKFILLHISEMNQFSHTEEVIDGLYYLLKQYRTMGLIIVGDGERRGQLEKRILDYGLEAQILFGSPDTDVLSCMKSAQVLIHTSADPSQDEIVLKAAAAGVPIICGDRGLASEFFIDEESVLLCPLGQPACFGEKANRLLNDPTLRQSLALNARGVVFESIEQDYGTYLSAYRSAIEGCLVAEGKTAYNQTQTT